MARSFDLLAIGTGSAALSVAYPCRAAGWSVAVADSRPYGGTCANRGCDPKKVLVGAAEVTDWARRMRGKGVRAAEICLDWPELMRFKRSFTDPVPAGRERALREAGIVCLHGEARFVAEDAMEVAGERLNARSILLAAGAAPAPLGIPGERLALTSDDFLELERLPAQMVFVGGGYIAFEFAHLAARAGSQVTILHRGKRPLENFDADLVEQLVAYTRRTGIDVRVSTPVRAIERVEERLAVSAGEDLRVEADAVVHAAGRAPALEPLHLDAGHVESTPKGITVNEYLQSVSNPRVYAAGDAAASGPPLTPVAGYHGRIVADNLLYGNHSRADYAGCASCVFSLPPLAAVGLTEEAARQQGLQFDVHKADTAQWYSSRRVAEECSGYKLLLERKTGAILGAHLLGEGASEMINVFALAIRAGLRAADVRQTLFAYPTHGSNAQYML
jgi:glutathione reductase (NADPH)